jgi:hypothetical protein
MPNEHSNLFIQTRVDEVLSIYRKFTEVRRVVGGIKWEYLYPDSGVWLEIQELRPFLAILACLEEGEMQLLIAEAFNA